MVLKYELEFGIVDGGKGLVCVVKADGSLNRNMGLALIGELEHFKHALFEDLKDMFDEGELFKSVEGGKVGK